MVRVGMGDGHHDRRNGDRETENVAFLPSGYIGASGTSQGVSAESLITSANVFSASATAPPPMPTCVWDDAFEASRDARDPMGIDDPGGDEDMSPRSGSGHRRNLFIEADAEPQVVLSDRSSRGRAGTRAPRGALMTLVPDAPWRAAAAAYRADAARFARPSQSTLRRLVAVRPSRLVARRQLAAAATLVAIAGATPLAFLGGSPAKNASATADWRTQLRPYQGAGAPLPASEQHALALKHDLITIPASMLASR
jgi:hypothetical protein